MRLAASRAIDSSVLYRDSQGRCRGNDIESEHNSTCNSRDESGHRLWGILMESFVTMLGLSLTSNRALATRMRAGVVMTEFHQGFGSSQRSIEMVFSALSESLKRVVTFAEMKYVQIGEGTEAV